MTNTLKLDPTRTTLIRRQYAAEFARRMDCIRVEINKLVIDEDAFGLNLTTEHQPTQNVRWIFQTVADKVKSFRQWLTSQVNANILQPTDQVSKPWYSKYIESAYRKGIIRGWTQAKDLSGAEKQFIESSFNAPVRTSKLQLLFTRAYEDLRGFTEKMSSDTSRILADGMASGKGTREIAKSLTDKINIEKPRARTIARTEMIHAHAEGQLDSYKEAGIKGVKLLAEWITAAGVDATVAEMKAAGVCPRCQEMSGVILTVDEARGLIPLHPNCRCAWLPST